MANKSSLSRYGNIIPYSVEVAKKIGRTEALVLAQIDYWINLYKEREKNDNHKKHFIDGHWVTYLTIKDLQIQLGINSNRTISQAIGNLSSLGILRINHYSGGNYGRTNWYSIDFTKLDQIMKTDGIEDVKNTQCEYMKDETQNEIENVKSKRRHSVKSKSSEDVKSKRTITKTSTEITTKNTINSCSLEKQEHGNSPQAVFDFMRYKLNSGVEICNNIKYFLEKYEEFCHQEHPYISRENLLKIYDQYYNYWSSDNIEYEDWRYIIDDYFNQTFKEDCDYRIFHFFSGDIIKNLYYHVRESIC